MWSLGTELIGEHYISGRELTVSVLNGKALCVTEIIANADFYNYKAKYEIGGSKHILPANVPEKCALKAKLWAEKAFNLIGCRGVTRADFRWEEDTDKLYLLELNTQPGMTQTSLVPEQVSFCNLSMHHLINLLIEAAQCD